MLFLHGFLATQGEAIFSDCVGDFDEAGGGGGERLFIFPLSELVAFNWLSGVAGSSLWRLLVICFSGGADFGDGGGLVTALSNLSVAYENKEISY